MYRSLDLLIHRTYLSQQLVKVLVKMVKEKKPENCSF